MDTTGVLVGNAIICGTGLGGRCNALTFAKCHSGRQSFADQHNRYRPVEESSDSTVSHLLEAVQTGDQSALDELYSLVDGRLRLFAHRRRSELLLTSPLPRGSQWS
jgi:hypothetical protein